MKVPDCTLCRIAAHEMPAVIIHQDDSLMVIMDLYPASTGHVLIVPNAHVEDIFDMSDELAGKVMVAATGIARAMRKSLSPDGLNLIQANGVAAGQTIRHFHLHLVPRWERDSIILKFGHGGVPAGMDDLRLTARTIRDAFRPG